MIHIVSQNTKQGTLVSLKLTYVPGVVWWTAVKFLVHHDSCSCLPSSVWCSVVQASPRVFATSVLSSHWTAIPPETCRPHPKLKVNISVIDIYTLYTYLYTDIPSPSFNQRYTYDQITAINANWTYISRYSFVCLANLIFGSRILLDRVFFGEKYDFSTTAFIWNTRLAKIRGWGIETPPPLNSLNVSKPYMDWPRAPTDGG